MSALNGSARLAGTAGRVTTSRRALISRHLTEYRALEFAPLRSGQQRVDREKGEIYGVKIAGKVSDNRHQVDDVSGTDYTEQAFRDALPSYEGARVFVGHPKRDPTTGRPIKEDRPPESSFGKTFGVYLDGGEVFGNLRVLKSHPMFERLMEAAENEDLADCFALSHNAWGKGEVQNGRYVITKIDVHSVDLVSEGGTNRSLWESRESPMKTLRQLIESALKSGRLKRQKGWKRLLEDDAMAPAMDTPAEAPPAAAGGEEPDEVDHIYQAFKKVKDDNPAMAKKLLSMLKMCCKGEDEEEDVEESEEDEEPESREDTEDEDTGGEKDRKKKDAMESRLRELEAKDACRTLCESLDFAPSKLQLEALMAFGTEAKRKEFIKEQKTASPSRRGPQSRSLIREQAGEVQEARVPRDPDAQLQWLGN